MRQRRQTPIAGRAQAPARRPESPALSHHVNVNETVGKFGAFDCSDITLAWEKEFFRADESACSLLA